MNTHVYYPALWGALATYISAGILLIIGPPTGHFTLLGSIATVCALVAAMAQGYAVLSLAVIGITKWYKELTKI